MKQDFSNTDSRDTTREGLSSLINDSEAATIDEQIKGIHEYLKARTETLGNLPDLPREALRELVTIRKYASVDETKRVQTKIMGNLQERFGHFDESNLVLFLVKYLM